MSFPSKEANRGKALLYAERLFIFEFLSAGPEHSQCSFLQPLKPGR